MSANEKKLQYDPAALDGEREQKLHGMLMLQRAMAEAEFRNASVAECERIWAAEPTKESE